MKYCKIGWTTLPLVYKTPTHICYDFPCVMYQDKNYKNNQIYLQLSLLTLSIQN